MNEQEIFDYDIGSECNVINIEKIGDIFRLIPSEYFFLYIKMKFLNNIF